MEGKGAPQASRPQVQTLQPLPQADAVSVCRWSLDAMLQANARNQGQADLGHALKPASRKQRPSAGAGAAVQHRS